MNKYLVISQERRNGRKERKRKREKYGTNEKMYDLFNEQKNKMTDESNDTGFLYAAQRYINF